MDEKENEISISTFDYQQILPHHSILIVENDPERAAACINRILRTVSSVHLKSSFEQGEIFTSPHLDPPARFRFPKRVQPFEKKTFALDVLDVYQRQGFDFSFTADPARPETYPLHFLPRKALTLHPFLQGLNEKQYLYLNKLLRIPRSFLVLHHCFGKTFPKNETLVRLLTSHNIHHRLLLIVSCMGIQSVPKELCEQFDWVFYFEHEQENQWKRWYRLAFSSFFSSSKIFQHFMKMTKPSQGLVIRQPYEYQEIAASNTQLRHSLVPSLPPMSKENPIQNSCIAIVKRLKLVAPRQPSPSVALY